MQSQSTLPRKEYSMINKSQSDKKINEEPERGDTQFDISELKFLFIILAPISLGLGLLGVKLFGFSFDDLGTYGDFIGGGTIPFLTIASILFVVETIKLQKKQVKIQEKEMIETRKTLEEQNKTARMQRFENTFFKFLEQLKSILISNNFTHVDGFLLESPEDYFRILDNKYSHIKKEIHPTHNIHLLNENNKEEYFQQYGDWLDEAYLKLPISNSYHSFTFHIEKLLQLILHYHSEMDEWEVNFYLELVLNEVGNKGINMLLYSSVLGYGIDLQVVKRIGLINHTTAATFTTRRDYDFINYVIETNHDVSQSLSDRISS
jgi:hypothetical protein